MKCPHCQCEWNMPQGMSLSGKNCPFCGKPLVEPVVQKSDAMEDVLAAILAEHGRDSLKNGKLVLSLYKDMAPKRKRDQKLLAYFVEADGPNVLYSALSVAAADRKTYLQRVVYKMTNDLIIAEIPSCTVCQLYWKILSGETVELAPQKKQDPDPMVTLNPTPEPAPTPVVKTDPDDGDWDGLDSESLLRDLIDTLSNAAGEITRDPSGNTGYSTTAAEGAAYRDEDFEIDGDILVKYKGSDNKIRVPTRVKTIGSGAFEGNDKLTAVYLPDYVTDIGDSAFANCSALEEVHLSKNLLQIGAFAFESCKKLKKIDLSASLKTLDMGAFVDCTGLEEVIVPGGVERIGGMTFSGCSSLNKVALQPGVKHIASTAFSGCTALKQIALPDSMESIASNAFSKCDRVQVVPSGTWANPKERRFASTPRLYY